MLFSILSLISVVSAAASSGCRQASTQAAGSDQNYTITIGPHDRDYMVFLPATYSPSTSGSPLILSFHGNNRSDWQQEQLSQMSDPRFNTDHVVVYPQGYENHWQPGPYAIPDASDLDFTAALLDKLEADFCIDTNRIYAAGKSVGGGFVGELACDPNLGPKFAAFAPVSGAFYWEGGRNHTKCDITTRLTSTAPMMEFHGLDDDTIPYGGGRRHHTDLPSITAWASWWKIRNGCDPEQSPVITTSHDGHVEQIAYPDCDVVHWTIDNLAHQWPSTSPNFDNPDSSYMNATTHIMEWFRKYSLPTQSFQAQRLEL